MCAEQASFVANFGGREEGQMRDELWTVDTRKHSFRVLRRAPVQPASAAPTPPSPTVVNEQAEQEACCVCLEAPAGADRIVTPCAHVFCRPCLGTWYNEGKKECPLCRRGLRTFGRANGLYQES